MKKHSKPIWSTESIIFATFLKNPMWQSKKFNHNDHYKEWKQQEMKFPRHHRLTYPANPTAPWRWNKVRQTNPRPQTPIWPWMIAHSVPLSFSLSPTLSLSLSLSLSLPLYLSPSIPLALYISLAIFIFFYYTHYSIFLSSKTTPFLKKAKMTERIALKGALSLVQINTHGLPKKKKINTHG